MCMKRKHKHKDEKNPTRMLKYRLTLQQKKAAFPVSKVFLLQALSKVERLA